MQTTVTMPDGRSLDIVVHGERGPAVLFHHSTPSAAESYGPWVAAAAAQGLRWISYSRPGYGRSSRHDGRLVADAVGDVAAILDQLEVERFVSMGWSGGGPHALACGALLAPRCTGVVALASVAPWHDSADAGLDWLAGMGPENHAEFGAAFLGEDELADFLQRARAELVDIAGPQVAEAFGGLVDAPDIAVLTGQFAVDVAEGLSQGLQFGVSGWLDDDLAFVAPWGFELPDVEVPVSLWQGEDDRMVPYSHGQFIAARLPDVRAHLLAGEGHLSISLGKFDEILAEAQTFF